MDNYYFQNIIETTQDGFWLVDETGKILDVNAAYTAMSGYSKAELLKMSIPDLEARESRSDTAEHIRKIIETGTDRFESIHRSKDGSCFVVDVSTTYLPEINQFVSFIRDISEHKQIVETLRQSEERFRHLSDATFEAIVFHEEGFIVHANDQYYKMFGYAPEELAGIDAISLTATSDSIKHIKHQISSGNLGPYEVVGLKKDGTEFPIEIHNKIVKIQNQNIRVAAIRDLTKQKQTEEELRKSEVRFKRYYDLGLVGMATISLEKGWLDFNNTLHNMFGYSRDDFAGLTWTELTYPEDLEADLAQFNQVLAGEIDGYSMEKRFIRKDGSILFADISVNALRKSDGSVDYFVALIYDITKRKQFEEKLKISEERSRTWLEHSPVCTKIVDLDFNLQYMSSAGIKGLKIEDVTLFYGKPYPFDFYPDSFKTVMTGNLEKVKSTGQVIEQEASVFDTEGNELWFHSTLVPVNDEKGRIDYIIIVSLDITERKQAEEALEQRMVALTRPLDSPERVTFEELFNLDDIQRLQDQFAKATGVASIITKTDGTPITKPSNFCRLCKDIIRKTEKGLLNCYKSDAVLGRKKSEGPTIQRCLSGGLWDAGAGISVGGKHIANWLIGQVRDESQTDEQMKAYAREIGTDEEAFIEALHEVPSMQREQFEVVSEALFSFANQLSAMAYQNVQQARFISESKLAEKEKKKLEKQLYQAQKMEAIGTLAGGIAHDFNNILSAVIGYAELAREDSPRGSSVAQDIDRILEAGNRAKELVQQILSFSRQIDTECVSFAPASLVRETLKMLRPTIPSTIEIIKDIAPHTRPIFADPTQIIQIFINLCTNASQALEKTGGKLGVSLKETQIKIEDLLHEPDIEAGTFIQFSVWDTGPGIPPGIMEKIFDPFFSTKETGKGTGMGLSIVHGIAKKYGGFISIETEKGKGTTFHVFLPVDEKGVEAEEETQVADQALTGKERILFIDDEELLAKMGKVILERLGYIVTVRKSSFEALDTFQNQPDNFDLVITDQTMPGMTGADLSREMLQIRPDIPIILCTGYSTIISREKAESMGIREFALKPLSTKNLAVLVRKVLDAS